jgi:hypothetical protein
MQLNDITSLFGQFYKIKLGLPIDTEVIFFAEMNFSTPFSRTDFVAFDHRPHVAASVACQNCHGPVERMDRLRQFSTLGMGWCVNCHRESLGDAPPDVPVAARLDCATCHH